MAAANNSAVGPPAEDPDNANDWTTVNSTKKKRGVHGSKLVEPSFIKERKFIVSIPLRNNDNDNAQHNLSKLHKEFITKIFETAKDIVIKPSSRVDGCCKTTMTATAPFPDNDKNHRLFFHRQIQRSNDNKQSYVKIHHTVQTATSIKTIKDSLMTYLRARNIYMSGGELDTVELWNIGFLQGCHHQMVYRPELELEINNCISMDANLDRLMTEYNIETTSELPGITCQLRTINWGAGTNRVTSNTTSILCVKQYSEFYKAILLNAGSNLPYEFIPAGMATMTSPELYRNILIGNNDMQNELTSIPIVAMPRELFDESKPSTNGVEKSIYDLFMHTAAIESIQATQHTDTKGRWLVLVYKTSYDEAKAHIQNMFETIIPSLPNSKLAKYTAKMGSLPKIYTPSPFGCEIHEKAESLALRLSRLHAIADPSNNNSTNSNKKQQYTTVVFDDLDAFPPLDDSKIEPASTTNPTSVPTNQTVISTDVDTVISELKSIVSQQLSQMQVFVEKQSRAMQEQNDALQLAMNEQNKNIQICLHNRTKPSLNLPKTAPTIEPTSRKTTRPTSKF